MRKSPAATGRTVIRWPEFTRLADAKGWTTDAERARQLGITQAALTNLRAGRTGVGPAVIDACLRAFGSDQYETLFTRETPR